ncbi:MAG: hypothetical protein A2987_02605 [Omnitrophica bacterium RIFCSPLOWO2_01_FULL_45_10]|nr:MAG: hypothetical protein A2987_02605 [Omnitrophica bacterium RIFCSPLOWO2_01_FULL_45_10]
MIITILFIFSPWQIPKRGSPERQGWLPELDARRTSPFGFAQGRQPQEIHLLVKITIRRRKGGFILLGQS